MSDAAASHPPGVDGRPSTPDELAFLADLGRAISSFQDRDELLRFTLDTALALLGSESGSLYLYQPDTEELVLSVARGPDREQRLGLRQRLGEGVAGQVALERKPILVTDIGSDLRFSRHRSRRYKSTSFICAPLLVSNELAGLITITMKRPRNGGDPPADGQPAAESAFTDDELRVLSILAGHAASAIENLRLYQELKDFNRQLAERVAQATEELSAANRELAHLQAFKESILVNIPVGVLTFDRDFTVTYHNQVVSEMLGAEGGSLTGRSVADLFARLEVDRALCPWERSLAAVVAEGAPAEFVRVDCRANRVADLHATALRDAAGAIVGGLLTLEDTTRKLAMERKLANTERMASVGQLAARVAHELNNPLDGIMRFINLAIRVQPPESPAVKYLQQSRTGLMRMVAIIRDLLKFSRSTFGALETTHVNQLVEEAVKVLASKAASQGIDIRTDYGEGLPPVRAGNLFQVLYNLITNAIDAMPDGGVLTLTTRAREGASEIRVADTGVGIPEAIRERIFEPFFTTKEAGKGTGLGLAICRDIVQKHEGTLTLTSEEGRGSEFVVRIPNEL
jgi:PAS domain S-box-containing protein